MAILGEKGRSQSMRTHGNAINAVFDEHSKNGITFSTCPQVIAERLVDGDYDRMSVLLQLYKSMIVINLVEKSLDNMAAYTKSARSGDSNIENMPLRISSSTSLNLRGQSGGTSKSFSSSVSQKSLRRDHGR